ncbi:ABC transporter permease [Micromonospora sp. NPDC047707]|uniref:ABC transporter permease n=1 Tax=unclassified Micromonospora TaxID=2617518 RepID=UPI0012B4D577|nr:ABC transporter permease [Micromonospora sp. WMMC415]QGN49200.1 ABC transporter permease subunit [Micromonospora sp. WMMC415]
MATYLLKRLGMTVVVVLTVMTFLSLLVHLVPGDPVEIVLGPQATPAQVEVVRAEMGLDDPIPVQVWDFVVGALRGDLGLDFLSRTPVTQLIAEAIPHTVVLAITALGLAALVGIPLGVYAARRQNSLADRAMALLSIGFITMPSYIAALLLLIVFAVQLDVLPALGTGSFANPLDYATHLVLPACALAIAWIGYVARLVRTSMLSVLGSNYVRTSRAFGVRDRIIFYKWALKNAIIPTVAVLSSGLADLLGGAVLVEIIFSRPGLGRLTVEAISERNFPIVQGAVLVIALFYVLTNLLADLSYRLVDPRIRVEDSAVGA